MWCGCLFTYNLQLSDNFVSACTLRCIDLHIVTVVEILVHGSQRRHHCIQ